MSNKLLLDFIKIKGMLLSDHLIDEGKVNLTEFSLTGFHLCMWVGCGTIHAMITKDFVDERFTDPEDLAYLCKGNLTDLRRILHLSLAKGNPK
jgi:hypothetical protein